MSFCLNSFLSFSPFLPPSLIAPNFESNDSWKQLVPPFDSIDRSPLRSSESRGSTFRALRGPRLNRIYDLVRKRKSVPRESDVYYREEERERGGGEGGTFVAHERCGSAGSDPSRPLILLSPYKFGATKSLYSFRAPGTRAVKEILRARYRGRETRVLCGQIALRSLRSGTFV